MVDEEEMLAEIGGKKARVENFSGIQVLSPPVSQNTLFQPCFAGLCDLNLRFDMFQNEMGVDLGGGRCACRLQERTPASATQ